MVDSPKLWPGPVTGPAERRDRRSGRRAECDAEARRHGSTPTRKSSATACRLPPVGPYDLVKLHSKLRLGGREEIIIHVGNNRQSKAPVKVAKRGHGIRPRLPFFQGLRQRPDFLVCRHESEFFSELPHHGLKNFAVAAILPLLSTGFEIAVKSQDGRIVCVLPMGCEQGMHAAKNSIFPVDESPVAIKGKKFESAEVEQNVHASFLSS